MIPTAGLLVRKENVDHSCFGRAARSIKQIRSSAKERQGDKHSDGEYHYTYTIPLARAQVVWAFSFNAFEGMTLGGGGEERGSRRGSPIDDKHNYPLYYSPPKVQAPRLRSPSPFQRRSGQIPVVDVHAGSKHTAPALFACSCLSFLPSFFAKKSKFVGIGPEGSLSNNPGSNRNPTHSTL